VVLAGLLSPIPPTASVAIAVAMSLVVLAADRGLGGLRLPETRRQIPPTVIAAGRPAGAWRFGAIYGSGLLTYLPNAAPHLLVVWLALTATAPTILLAGVGFGLGRGLPLLARSVSTDRLAFQHSLERTAALARHVVPPALLVLGAFVAWP
jgi:hypothetical protein